MSFAADARRRASALESAGFDLLFDASESGKGLKRLRDGSPEAIVIDLSRQPMLGRDIGIAVRRAKATRNVPLVFAGGVSDRVTRVRETLPDAVFTSWRSIRRALEEALASQPANPVVPGSLLAGYSGTPLPKKLGIKPGLVVALLGAPGDFEQTLGRLPEGVRLRRDARGRWDTALWFVTSRRELERRIERLRPPPGAGLWICWPKKSSALASELTQAAVREVGLAAGLVDHKVCAVDETWSALRFVVRGAKKRAPPRPRPSSGRAPSKARSAAPDLPDDLRAALEAAGRLEAFRAQPPSHQREHLRTIDAARRPETRARRIARRCERLRE